MSDVVNVTSKDIALVKQHNQVRHSMLRIVNREKRNVYTVIGRYISGGVDIDETSSTRRTANVTMQVYENDIVNLAYLFMNYYVRLYEGIEDNDTLEVSWYLQGTFIINQNSVKFDKATKTLSFSLSDLMTDLTGDRAGVLHAYQSITKNSQRIDDVMKNVLEICGVTDYDITPICAYRKAFNFWDEKQSEEDFLVPYDLEFPAGVTAYDILDKLVNLYPNWEMFFDLNGRFICQRKVVEEDNSYVTMDAERLSGLIISESINIDWSKVKNIVEIWGKEGKFYGEAKDENPESPFNVAANKPLRLVETKDQIYDRYSYPDEKTAEKINANIDKTKKEIGVVSIAIVKDEVTLALLKKNGGTPEEIKKLQDTITKNKGKLTSLKSQLQQYESQSNGTLEVSGDDMAKEWAEQLLYENCRMKDSITLECIGLPFLNNTGFKLSYRSKIDNKIRTYIVKSISHSTSNNSATTTINAIRFYAEQSSALQNQLDAPTIINADINGMVVTVTVSEVKYAEQYNLYIDRKLSATSTGTTLSFELPAKYAGEHYINVEAYANEFAPNETETIVLNFARGIDTADGDTLVTANAKTITIL